MKEIANKITIKSIAEILCGADLEKLTLDYHTTDGKVKKSNVEEMIIKNSIDYEDL
jgi:hypothetical protein